jgi:TolB protein
MRQFLTAVVLCSLAGASLGVPAPRKTELRILFPSNRSGQFNIYLMKPTGKDARNLTDHKSENIYPAISPDGKKIAFTSNRDGQQNIYVMDFNGKNVKQLTKGGDRCRAPAWSPDGKKIAYIRHVQNTNAEIYVMDADGKNPVNLTNHNAYDADPAWMPDGKSIVFVSDRDGGGFRVYRMDANGKNVKVMTVKGNTFGSTYPAVSPDGKKIVYSEPVNNGLELFVMDGKTGDNKKQLTKLGGRNTLAAWSPDGKKIAFLHIAPGAQTGSLYVMGANGARPKEIVKSGGAPEGSRPAWDSR